MKIKKKFNLSGGRWFVGNLYDALDTASFDRFVNLHREPERVKKKCRSFPLYVYNYKFNFTN